MVKQKKPKAKTFKHVIGDGKTLSNPNDQKYIAPKLNKLSDYESQIKSSYVNRVGSQVRIADYLSQKMNDFDQGIQPEVVDTRTRSEKLNDTTYQTQRMKQNLIRLFHDDGNEFELAFDFMDSQDDDIKIFFNRNFSNIFLDITKAISLEYLTADYFINFMTRYIQKNYDNNNYGVEFSDRLARKIRRTENQLINGNQQPVDDGGDEIIDLNNPIVQPTTAVPDAGNPDDAGNPTPDAGNPDDAGETDVDVKNTIDIINNLQQIDLPQLFGTDYAYFGGLFGVRDLYKGKNKNQIKTTAENKINASLGWVKELLIYRNDYKKYRQIARKFPQNSEIKKYINSPETIINIFDNINQYGENTGIQEQISEQAIIADGAENIDGHYFLKKGDAYYHYDMVDHRFQLEPTAYYYYDGNLMTKEDIEADKEAERQFREHQEQLRRQAEEQARILARQAEEQARILAQQAEEARREADAKAIVGKKLLDKVHKTRTAKAKAEAERQAQEAQRQADELKRQAEEAQRQADEAQKQAKQKKTLIDELNTKNQKKTQKGWETLRNNIQKAYDDDKIHTENGVDYILFNNNLYEVDDTGEFDEMSPAGEYSGKGSKRVYTIYKTGKQPSRSQTPINQSSTPPPPIISSKPPSRSQTPINQNSIPPPPIIPSNPPSPIILNPPSRTQTPTNQIQQQTPPNTPPINSVQSLIQKFNSPKTGGNLKGFKPKLKSIKEKIPTRKPSLSKTVKEAYDLLKLPHGATVEQAKLHGGAIFDQLKTMRNTKNKIKKVVQAYKTIENYKNKFN